MLQNTRVSAFTVSEFLRENQQGGKITPSPSLAHTHTLRLGLNERIVCMVCIDFLSSNKQSTLSWWLMYFLTTFFFTLFTFFISYFFVFNEYIFVLKSTNSSIISPFNLSFILLITFLFSSLQNGLSFLYPENSNKCLST